MTATLDVVVGANYGSEAKGHMVQRLAERRLAETKGGRIEVIRVAGPNAGHTGHDALGNRWSFRQLPVAAVVPGQMILGIAPGSEIDKDVLLDEIDQAKAGGLLEGKEIWVSGEATIIEVRHKHEEQGVSESGGNLVSRIGSTGKGIGAARAARLMRRAKRVTDDDNFVDKLYKRGVNVIGPLQYGINDYPWPVIVEGTQGYGLGLHAGHYPQVTSSDCRAIDFLAMAGINPWNWDPEDFNVWAVARVFPIRVAGNSGPLKDETSWEELGLPEEHTTVTKKVRRVGQPDWQFVKRAVEANGPKNVKLAVFMLDQKFKEVEGASHFYELGQEAVSYIKDIEHWTGASVSIVGTGPNSVVWKDGYLKKSSPGAKRHPATHRKGQAVELTVPGPEDPLRQWWADTAQRHSDMVVPKMHEYGSNDLVEIGREFAHLAGREALGDDLLYELGVFFYLRGKVARWSAAVGRGEAVSQDTLDDIAIYTYMVLNRRQQGEEGQQL